jgi:DNA-binding PadR family transcriptional regulator
MNDAGTLVLLALTSGPRHGYAIQQEVESRTGVRLGPGTLYGAIARLEDAGLIAPMQTSERRQPYRITKSGRGELARRMESIRSVAAWAKAVGAAR